jgi:hypothetical protein
MNDVFLKHFEWRTEVGRKNQRGISILDFDGRRMIITTKINIETPRTLLFLLLTIPSRLLLGSKRRRNPENKGLDEFIRRSGQEVSGSGRCRDTLCSSGPLCFLSAREPTRLVAVVMLLKHRLRSRQELHMVYQCGRCLTSLLLLLLLLLLPWRRSSKSRRW